MIVFLNFYSILSFCCYLFQLDPVLLYKLDIFRIWLLAIVIFEADFLQLTLSLTARQFSSYRFSIEGNYLACTGVNVEAQTERQSARMSEINNFRLGLHCTEHLKCNHRMTPGFIGLKYISMIVSE